MALNDRKIKTARPRSKRYKLSDSKGLYLLVEVNGSKKWRYKYYYLGKEKLIGLGKYPSQSLADARDEREECRKLLDQNIDPSSNRKNKKRLAEYKNKNTFEAVAKDWFDLNFNKWTARHAGKLWKRLELHMMPSLSKRPISEITAIELLDILRELEKYGKTETTHKILQNVRAIFQYAVLTQKTQYNPANDLKGVLKPHVTKSYPAITHRELKEFLQDLKDVKTTRLNKLAVKMLLYTFVRTGELRRAKWRDIDFDAHEWRVDAATTKMRTLHIVPLSRGAESVLRQIKKISGGSEYLFPSQNLQKNPYMSENTVNNLIHKMGYKGEMVGHGFRSLASTVLNENGFSGDVIERQLAHMPRDKVRAAYNRAEYLLDRRNMMQWWSDYLSKL